MRVDPALAALRSRPAPQRDMFAAREAWRGREHVAPVLAGLEAHGRGAALEACSALAALFAPGEAAGRLAAEFCRSFAGALESEPFGQVPFRHGFDGVLATLLLARAGRAHLTLVAQEPGEHAGTAVLLSDALRHDAVIAGRAEARLVRRSADGTFECRTLDLAAGSRLSLDLSREALQVIRVERRLVALRLHRAAAAPGPVREHALADGALLRQSLADVRQSRQEMMLALLGRMRRTEAAPLMAEIAREEGPDTLRWEALREALALDTASGFAALCRIARAPADPLSGPAGALRAQLVEAHPELLAFEELQCRA